MGTEALALSGKRIVITRALDQAAELARQLEQRGAEVLYLPAVSYIDPEDVAPLDGAIHAVGEFDWIFFTSQNAVCFFLKRCRMMGIWGGEPEHSSMAVFPSIAAVGPATARAAESEGLRVEYIAGEFRGEALAAELGARVAGRRILLPRSDRAGEDLPAALRACGAEVVEVVAYRTVAPETFDARVAEAIVSSQVDVLVFASPSAFQNLLTEIGRETLLRTAARTRFAAIGPIAARAIRQAGLPVEIEAGEATSSALAAAIENHFARRVASEVRSS